MLNDILAAIPWGFLLAFTIGPVFFVLLETSITKGFRAAMVFDAGVVFGDLVFILIAYFSTNQILERLKDDPALFIFGGVIMLTYGIISFIKEKKDFLKKRDEEQVEEDNIPKNNYLGLFFKGFFLNFINIGVLAFWMGIIIVFGPKLNMETDRIVLFIAVIILTYFAVDILKIMVAKQLKSRLTPNNIYKIKRVISVILMIFGSFLIVQGFFPNEKKMIEQQLGIGKTLENATNSK
ncbi:Threonine/homoserine/homoserine lactone efflux protein [Flavobacterium fontis]|jgi:threonine/homoserine/homoserine lactone efflux protein|uniref:Threonine/homoserine/homoserine lactone efflux protein n=1 Tax=Flavobacterium fontis TaxID=1124188 RepID=A0A1M4VT20_9FLAO|nr:MULTISPECIES: LysE family transporter [Flavobacterium]MCZ8168386.1 LysE family transporter [Flavobacterium sp.]MCZ8296656.1 LysE family transporter [Flavobacterium sp.]SHE72007.1 Threonine/homoserine/homoserine lactone efflux protein [Flavobacterium fontis]